MKIEDILNMSASELSGLSTRELQKVTNSLVDASNKRLKRLEAKGLHHSSTAYQKRATKATREKGGELTAKFTSNVRKIKSDIGKRNRLKEIIATTKYFLMDKTSTIPGALAQARNILEKTGVSYDDFFFFKNGKPKKGKLTNFWESYNRFKQEHINQMPNEWERKTGGSRGSPIELVEEFFENVYKYQADSRGRMRVSTIKEYVKGLYETKEGELSADGDELLERVDSPRGASSRQSGGKSIRVETFEVSTDNPKKTRKSKK